MEKSKKQKHKSEGEKFERRQAGFKSLLTVQMTEPFIMICPICGGEVKAQAVARQRHWAYDTLEFSVNFVTHTCPAIVKSQKDAYIAMCGPWLQDLPFYSSEQYERDYQKALATINEQE